MVPVPITHVQLDGSMTAVAKLIQTCLVRTAPPVVIACSEQVVTKVLVTVLVTFVHLDGLKATLALPVIKAFLVTTDPSHAIVYRGKDVTMFLATVQMINVPLAGLIVIVALSVIAYTVPSVTMSPVTVPISNVSLGGPRVTVSLYTRLLRTKLLYELSLRNVPSRKWIVRRVFQCHDGFRVENGFCTQHKQIGESRTVNAAKATC
ncbi:hypothetical protein DPMN_155827, partial [Dreissena polymorpha]